MFRSGLRQGAFGRGLFFWALLVAAYPVEAEVCNLLKVGPQAGLESSEWAEYSDSGVQVVRETGTLRSTGLFAKLHCLDVEFALDWSRSQGQRQYAGVTNRQKAVATITDIDNHALSGDLIYLISNSWAVGLKVEQRTTRRNIRTTPEAAGYPERFESLAYFGGARYQRPVSDDVTLSIEGWLGKGDPGTVWVNVPNADPTELALGVNHTTQVAIAIGKDDSLASGYGWGWSAQLNFSSTMTNAGPRTALMRGGRVVAIASQPRTETKTIGLHASVSYHF